MGEAKTTVRLSSPQFDDLKNSAHDIRNLTSQINRSIDGKVMTALNEVKGISGQLEAINETIRAGFESVVEAIANIQQPSPPPAQLKGGFTLILKNDQLDFGYDFDVSGITDAEGEAITDQAVLDKIVKEVASDNEAVVSATAPDAGGAGSIHVGTSGAAVLSGKAWLSQADKDAGKDPAFIATEPFTITTGDPAAITEGSFAFDVESGGTPPA